MTERPTNKVILILRKEWIELRQQWVLVFSTLGIPLLFAALPLAAAALTTAFPSTNESTKEMIDNLAKVNPVYSGMTDLEAAQTLVVQQLSIMFLLLPVILPSIIASFSIVGEKTSRTLEPVLATPVRTWELLLAKSLTALIPAVIATWLAGGVFIGGLALLALSSRVFAAVITPGWLIVFLLCTPLLGLITVAATVAVSSRVNDPRTAQQISVVLILPIMAFFIGQLTGLLTLSVVVALIAALVLLAASFVAIWIAVRLFHRETILTRWS